MKYLFNENQQNLKKISHFFIFIFINLYSLEYSFKSNLESYIQDVKTKEFQIWNDEIQNNDQKVLKALMSKKTKKEINELLFFTIKKCSFDVIKILIKININMLSDKFNKKIMKLIEEKKSTSQYDINEIQKTKEYFERLIKLYETIKTNINLPITISQIILEYLLTEENNNEKSSKCVIL